MEYILHLTGGKLDIICFIECGISGVSDYFQQWSLMFLCVYSEFKLSTLSFGFSGGFLFFNNVLSCSSSFWNIWFPLKLLLLPLSISSSWIFNSNLWTCRNASCSHEEVIIFFLWRFIHHWEAQLSSSGVQRFLLSKYFSPPNVFRIFILNMFEMAEFESVG